MPSKNFSKPYSTCKKLIDVFSAKTSQKWSDIYLNSYVYRIKVPKNSSMLIYLKMYMKQTDGYAMAIKPVKFPYSSIAVSPSYGTSKFNTFLFETGPFLTYAIENNPLKFTILDYNIQNGDSFYFQTDENTIL